MTISKRQMAEEKQLSFYSGLNQGKREGREQAAEELAHARKQAVIDLTKAAAELAQANAKLTYAMSQIANKLL